jgi:ribosome-associated protein
MKSKKASSLALAQLCCRTLDAKKAEDIRVLEVGALSSITDYLVIATANSETHLRALRIELEKELDASRTRIVGLETAQESGWTVIDAFDVMVHLFTAERRDHFRLEALWKDSVEIPIAKMLATKAIPEKGSRAKPAARKKPVAREKPAARRPGA